MANTNVFEQALEQMELDTGRSMTPSSEKVHAETIERMLRQCLPLLRQELDRKVKREPLLYDQQRAERTLRQFETSVPDIKEGITRRITAKVSEMIREEIRGILRDALSDFENKIVDPVWNQGTSRLLSSTTGQSPQQHAEHPPEKSSVSTSVSTGYQHAGAPSDGVGAAQGHDDTADGEVCQGNVKVSVETRGSMQHMARVLNQLSGNPQIRVLQMDSGNGSATVRLTLRSPLRLKELFSQIDGVSQVLARGDQGLMEPEHLFEVVLERTAGLATVA